MIPSFHTDSRLLIFAPHPDDESLACGIVLQRAVEAGATVLVVYLTDGENNPWPQRFLSRRWRLNPADRQKWAKMRRREALAALETLGVSPADARFLGWPDQGLRQLHKSQSAFALARLRFLIGDWQPTDVIGPDVRDRHADHSATGAILDRLFSRSGPLAEEIRRWTYVVHGRDRDFFGRAAPQPETDLQIDTKRRAIGCHQTQLLLSRRRFLSYATRPEALLLAP